MNQARPRYHWLNLSRAEADEGNDVFTHTDAVVVCSWAHVIYSSCLTLTLVCFYKSLFFFCS